MKSWQTVVFLVREIPTYGKQHFGPNRPKDMLPQSVTQAAARGCRPQGAAEGGVGGGVP